ncbi:MULTISPECIES: GNAT family N-acetyltransferase [Actinoalloteichus]|uniref:FR47-like protein n=1 Tax=Actinoalloteichus fjordicus TaxID=1612552 RepID=A0AAC9LDK3_9PSEU|nr:MULTISPECIES: GNAT family N-acetyltransferase [Actinoalloteichus]APU14904.1 FR47-like protein [Actinoalloteichus fjordicus]APU20874.1 FR47-like protein [Actinoalloteichus sp. GBA129-24]
MYAPTPVLSELIRRWQIGWGIARELPPAEEARGGLHVRHGETDRHTEIIALHADEDLDSVRALAEETADSPHWDWLTVPTRHPEAVAAVLAAAGLAMDAGNETFMTVRLDETPDDHPAPEPYTSTVAGTGSVLEATVRHPSRATAARGLMALTGRDAVAHAVETRPAHRRRGLASTVMTTLSREAAARGATTGLLVASPDGERLYSALGWSAQASVLIAKNGVGGRARHSGGARRSRHPELREHGALRSAEPTRI